MRIFVANIDFTVSEDDLKGMFSRFGEVKSAKLVIDGQTQRSRGYGFIEMPLKIQAYTAIENLDGKKINERALTVKKAHPSLEVN